MAITATPGPGRDLQWPRPQCGGVDGDGGGVKGGTTYGSTDEIRRFAPMENKVHIHDLHAGTCCGAAGLRPQEADLPLQWPRFPLHRRISNNVVKDVIAHNLTSPPQIRSHRYAHYLPSSSAEAPHSNRHCLVNRRIFIASLKDFFDKEDQADLSPDKCYNCHSNGRGQEQGRPAAPSGHEAA